MTPSPFDRLLMELQLLGRLEDREAVEFLEEYVGWKAVGGPKKYDEAKAARLTRHYRENYELRAKQTKRPEKKGQHE